MMFRPGAIEGALESQMLQCNSGVEHAVGHFCGWCHYLPR